jgi:hypothetical protein
MPSTFSARMIPPVSSRHLTAPCVTPIALESSNEVSGWSVGARGERCVSRRRSPQRWPSALALRGHQG